MLKSLIEKQLHHRPDRAILLLSALIDRYPNHASAMLHLGWTFEEQGDLTRAGMWFERATQVMPEYALAYVQLAKVRATQMEWPTTQKLALRAVELEPSLAEAHYLVGKALCAQGQPAEALTHALRAAEMQPQAPEFVTLVGNIYDRMGNGTEARIWHEHALSINPNLKSSVLDCGD
jgi:tetratricopeptide (TPR) repeat protein